MKILFNCIADHLSMLSASLIRAGHDVDVIKSFDPVSFLSTVTSQDYDYIFPCFPDWMAVLIGTVNDLKNMPGIARQTANKIIKKK